MIRREPITDPAEVVRCSECKHCRPVPFEDGTDFHELHICTGVMVSARLRPDTFCSWGVRRDA